MPDVRDELTKILQYRPKITLMEISAGNFSHTLSSNLILKSGLMYNFDMTLPLAFLEVLLEDAAARDRTTARRAALLQILYKERYLTRAQLITRVEGSLGSGCFGESAWEDTFYRDMQLVRRAFRLAGYQLAYSRSARQPGYYLYSQPVVDPGLAAVLAGSVAEVDLAQMAVLKKLSFAQRFRQGCSLIGLARRVVAHRLRQRDPQLGAAEANRLAVRKDAWQ